MYAVFKNQGKKADGTISYKVYVNSYTAYQGNWRWADRNMFGQLCSAHSSPKPATWKTRAAAERNAQKLIGYEQFSGKVTIEVHEIGPRDDDIKHASRWFASRMFDYVRASARGRGIVKGPEGDQPMGEAQDIIDKICAKAWEV